MFCFILLQIYFTAAFIVFYCNHGLDWRRNFFSRKRASDRCATSNEMLPLAIARIETVNSWREFETGQGDCKEPILRWICAILITFIT